MTAEKVRYYNHNSDGLPFEAALSGALRGLQGYDSAAATEKGELPDEFDVLVVHGVYQRRDSGVVVDFFEVLSDATNEKGNDGSVVIKLSSTPLAVDDARTVEYGKNRKRYMLLARDARGTCLACDPEKEGKDLEKVTDAWRSVLGALHDSVALQALIEKQPPPSAEHRNAYDILQMHFGKPPEGDNWRLALQLLCSGFLMIQAIEESGGDYVVDSRKLGAARPLIIGKATKQVVIPVKELAPGFFGDGETHPGNILEERRRRVRQQAYWRIWEESFSSELIEMLHPWDKSGNVEQLIKRIDSDDMDGADFAKVVMDACMSLRSKENGEADESPAMGHGTE